MKAPFDQTPFHPEVNIELDEHSAAGLALSHSHG
jgi:hypothetical protein